MSRGSDVRNEGAMGQSSEQVYSWEACLFNVRGLDAKTKNDNGFRAEFINGGRYKLICMCEAKLSEELDAWGGECLPLSA